MFDRIVDSIHNGNIDMAVKLIQKHKNNMMFFYLHRTAYFIMPIKKPSVLNAFGEFQKIGLNPNATPEKLTLLAEAVKHNNFDVAKFLLRMGADPYLAKEGYPNCFEMAKTKNNIPMLELLEYYLTVKS